jgi:hypothetical protein
MVAQYAAALITTLLCIDDKRDCYTESLNIIPRQFFFVNTTIGGEL